MKAIIIFLSALCILWTGCNTASNTDKKQEAKNLINQIYVLNQESNLSVKDVERIENELYKLGNSIVPILVNSFQLNQDVVSNSVKNVLVKLDNSIVCQELHRRLDNSTDNVRAWIIGTLAEVRSETSIPVLSKILLNDKSGRIRSAASLALGQIGTEEALKPFTKTILKDKESSVRANSALFLRYYYKYNPEETEKALTSALLKLDTPSDKCIIMRTMAKIKSEKFINVLLENLPSTNPEVSGCAYDSLKEITGLDLPNNQTLWIEKLKTSDK